MEGFLGPPRVALVTAALPARGGGGREEETKGGGGGERKGVTWRAGEPEAHAACGPWRGGGGSTCVRVCMCVCVCFGRGTGGGSGGGSRRRAGWGTAAPPPLAPTPLPRPAEEPPPLFPLLRPPCPGSPASPDGRTDGRTSLHRRRPAPAAPPTPPPPRAAAAARPGEEAEAGRGGPAERWGGRREGGVSSESCRRPPRPAETLGRGAGCRGGQPGVRGGEARLVSPFPSQNGAPDFPTSPYSCAWKGAAGEGRWWWRRRRRPGLEGLGPGLRREGESGDPSLPAGSPAVSYGSLGPATRAGFLPSSCLWGVEGEVGWWVPRFPFHLRLEEGRWIRWEVKYSDNTSPFGGITTALVHWVCST